MQPTQEPPAYTKSGQQTHEPKPNLNTEELQVSSFKQSWLNENYQIYINILNADVSFFSYSLRRDVSMIIIYSPPLYCGLGMENCVLYQITSTNLRYMIIINY